MSRVNATNDFTLCPAHTCPLNKDCLRYLTPPDFGSQYFFVSPYDKDNGDCILQVRIEYKYDDQMAQSVSTAGTDEVLAPVVCMAPRSGEA